MKLKTDEAYRAALVKKVKPVLWSVCRALILLIFMYLLFYPLLYMAVMVFRDETDFRNPAVYWITRNFTTENIKLAIKYLKYPQAFAYSAEIAVGSALLQTVSCALAGYGFARYKFKGSKIAFAILLATVIVPPQTTLLGVFTVTRRIGLLNSPVAFWLQALLGSGLRSGLFIYIYRQFFKGLPHDLEQAASIDGCSPFGTFFRVMLPNVTPGIVTVFFFSVVWHFNDNFVTKYLSPERNTLAGAIYALRDTVTSTAVSTGEFDVMTAQGIVQAGSLLMLLPMLILYFVLQRYLKEGIARTGIVG